MRRLQDIMSESQAPGGDRCDDTHVVSVPLPTGCRCSPGSVAGQMDWLGKLTVGG